MYKSFIVRDYPHWTRLRHPHSSTRRRQLRLRLENTDKLAIALQCLLQLFLRPNLIVKIFTGPNLSRWQLLERVHGISLQVVEVWLSGLCGSFELVNQADNIRCGVVLGLKILFTLVSHGFEGVSCEDIFGEVAGDVDLRWCWQV
jgi:hypothetical protein